MIQRIQSLLLLGIAVIAVVLYNIPFSETIVPGLTPDSETNPVICTLKLTGTSLNNAPAEEPDASGYILMLIDVLILVLSVYTIFLYKNRKGQMRLCVLGSLLATVFLILIFYFSENMVADSDRPHYLAGVYLAAIQVFLFSGARRFIRKDEMLVRAADRIR